MNSYMKSSFVLIVAFLLTALSTLCVHMLMIFTLPRYLADFEIIFEGGFILFFGGAFMQWLTKRTLFEKDDKLDLQVLGGVHFAGSVFKGKSASWPFAELSASPYLIRLQSPFGNLQWSSQDLQLSLKIGYSGWKISVNYGRAPPILFFAPPWKAKMVYRKLKELGY